MSWKTWLISVAAGVYAAIGRPWMLNWGAKPDEVEQPLVGDDLIPDPNLQATRAITIDAPPTAVWPWLSQMGRERAGFYGLDRLDNWNIPSVTHLRRNLPPLEAGIRLDNGLQVLDLEPSRCLLTGGFDMPNDLGGASDFTVLYWLVPIADNRTRLVVRLRCRSVGIRGWLFDRIFEVIDTALTVATLHGIKQRVEVTMQKPTFESVPLMQVDTTTTGHGNRL